MTQKLFRLASDFNFPSFAIRRFESVGLRASVLDCGSPLPLSHHRTRAARVFFCFRFPLSDFRFEFFYLCPSVA